MTMFDTYHVLAVVASLVTHVRDDVLHGNVTHTTVAPHSWEQSTGVRDAGDGMVVVVGGGRGGGDYRKTSSRQTSSLGGGPNVLTTGLLISRYLHHWLRLTNG